MDMDSDSEEEEESAPAEEAATAKPEALQPMKEQANAGNQMVHQPMPDAPTAGAVVVRDYDPKKARAQTAVGKAGLSEKYIISPLTNERIPADKLKEVSE